MTDDQIVGLVGLLYLVLGFPAIFLVVSFFNHGPIAPGLVGLYVRMCARGQAARDSEGSKSSGYDMSDLEVVSTRLRPRHYQLVQKVYDRRLQKLNQLHVRHTASVQNIDDIRKQQLRIKQVYDNARKEIR